MAENMLVQLFEHNNWANLQIIQACLALSDDQLDAEAQSATAGSIRATLVHLVSSQRGYLALLTLPLDARPTGRVAFGDLLESARASGAGLLALAKGDPSHPLTAPVRTRDGWDVQPWVVMVQVINHATEHREQIKSMLTALGVTPPEIDGWMYGEAVHAANPASKE